MKIQKVLSQSLLLSALVLFSAFAVAQDQGPDQGQQGPDPPSRVARVNMIQGSVSFQPGGDGDWVTAVPNRPMTTGDNLWADQNSRAELHIGSTAMRLNSETSMTLLDLDDQNTQVKLSQGSMIVRLRHIDDGDHFEVDTPNLAFQLQSNGEYRIDVSEDGNQTDVTVFKGHGEVTGGGYTYTVVGGQDARFTGNESLDYDIQQLPSQDEFDRWAFDRDHREDGPESSDYVSREMTGSEDLDDYGHWRYVAGYGNVWAPAGVGPDWAPYRNGHWVFVRPWGWTWVEDEPWGFAPFHYGRWAYAEGGWCWVPGPIVVRPVYAPALVAFVGGGGFHFSISIGGGGVGWFPLAPGEVYVPGYRVSRGYVNNINVTNTRVNVTQITNVYNVYNNTANVTRITYVNQHINNGVTVVSHDTFINARPVGRNIVRVDQREMEGAPAFHQAPGIEPVRQSMIGAGAPARFRPPTAVINRPVIATRNPQPQRGFEPRQPMDNVRTEQPGNPQHLETGSREAARPVQGMRPAPPGEPAMNPRPQQPVVNERPQEQRNIPRPPQPGQEPRQPESPGMHNDVRMPASQARENDNPRWQNPNPNVRQAPPVRDKTPEQQQNEERKFRNWDEGRRQQPAPKPPERQDSKPQGDKGEKSDRPRR